MFIVHHDSYPPNNDLLQNAA